MAIINKGFLRKRDKDDRLPPGQYLTSDFPVLSLGPTPRVTIKEWSVRIDGLVGKSVMWNWNECNALPQVTIEKDIHCVTKWSKFDTRWRGVSLDVVMEMVDVDRTMATHIIAYSYDGYTTNVPLEAISNGKAMIALAYDDAEIAPEHGGPARLLVPHLYFWKSAKWLKRIEFVDHDEPGFWETRGYHNEGDPWKEERYHFD